MDTFNIHEAKTQLSRLVERAARGEPFLIAKAGKPMVKLRLDRPDFRVDARILRRGLIDNGYGELPIMSVHVVAIDLLPPIHKDPFDRLLIAQAAVEGITLLNNDATVARYPGGIMLA